MGYRSIVCDTKRILFDHGKGSPDVDNLPAAIGNGFVLCLAFPLGHDVLEHSGSKLGG